MNIGTLQCIGQSMPYTFCNPYLSRSSTAFNYCHSPTIIWRIIITINLFTVQMLNGGSRKKIKAPIPRLPLPHTLCRSVTSATPIKNISLLARSVQSVIYSTVAYRYRLHTGELFFFEVIISVARY